jgi:hypothetical protein
MRSGKCWLGRSIITCRLVTRNKRPRRSKKKLVAFVSGRGPWKVQRRAAVMRRGSIIGA